MTSKRKYPPLPQPNKPPFDYLGWATFAAVLIVIGILVCSWAVR